MLDEAKSTASRGAADASSEPETLTVGRAPWIAFIFSLVAFQGLTINLVPVIMGAVAGTFDVQLLQRQGLLQTAFLGGGILSLFVSGFVTQSIRPVPSGLFAVSTLSLGLLLLGCAVSYWQVLCAALLIGVGNFWILAPYSAVITEHFPESRRRMFMLATAAFAFNAMIGNYTIGYLIARIESWQRVFLVLDGAIVLWFGAVLLANRRKLQVVGRQTRPPAVHASDSPSPQAAPWQAAVLYLYLELLNRWTLWILGLLIVLDNLASGNMVAWTARYFQLSHDIGDDQSGAMLAASAAGVFLGRIFLGLFVGGRFSDLAVLGACYAGAVATYSALLLVSSYGQGLVLFFLTSALMSAQAPTMYSIASAPFGPYAATAIPLIDAIGMQGSFMGPALLGELADRLNLHAALWTIPAAGAVFVMVVIAWEVHDRLTGRQAMSIAWRWPRRAAAGAHDASVTPNVEADD